MSSIRKKCFLFETDANRETPSYIKTLKIGLIGPQNAGKSELIKYLIKGNKHRSFEITGSCYVKGLRVNYDEEVAFILDVQEFTGPKKQQLRRIKKCHHDVYFLMYDVANSESFKEIKYKWLVDLHDMDVLLFVIGNKADAPEESKVTTRVPGVSDMGWHSGHVEVSSITGQKLDTLIQRTAEIILDVQVTNRAPDPDTLSIGVASLALSEDYDGIPTYDLSGTTKGLCLIFNIQNFQTDKKLTPRDGSGHDVREVKELFQSLGFFVCVQNNLIASDMIRTLQAAAVAQDQKKHKAFVCFIMSHGISGAVYGADGKEVPISEITKTFTAEECPFLRGKPKMFFIQACRGDTSQKSFRYEHDSPQNSSKQAETIPNEADFLLAMSTVDGYVSFRDPSTGSVFIQLLVECISQFRNLNIVDILTMVNDKASKMDFPDNSKQMTVFQSTLRRRLIIM